MNRKQMERLAARSGFTLIEVLLVVVIIGILVAVAVPRFSGRIRQSQENSARMEIKSLGTALNLFEVDNGFFPQNLNELMARPGNAKNWNGPYIDDVTDPWGNPYQYTLDTAGNYTLVSGGANGTIGDADDISNKKLDTAAP